ncbi:MAG: class I SAM-dependent methyltransferase [Lewinellaceae bacterium]|nr:class I SAM-dependent methyltransferase [Saprospiraceae bacterium]MCB9338765.1 class I SAM-dependent methyltransferase [Lewinellaceae bacterium]
MKINIHPAYLFLLFITLLFACADDSHPEGNSSTPSDTATQAPANGDTANLQNLVKQYESPQRVVWQKPELVIDKMGNLSNKVVADIGAGSGFFSRRLAQQAKKVIAIDIDDRFVHFMDSIKRVELKPEYQSRFETRLATPDDSRLKPGEADIVLIVNTYIYIHDRIGYLRKLLAVLPEGGEILIVDFKKKRIPINNPPPRIRLELFEVENELEEAGFTNIVSDDCALDYQYIVMAEKRP